MTRRKKIYRGLMFLFCWMILLSRPAMGADWNDTIHRDTDAATNVQYSFYIIAEGDDRAVITSVYVPRTVTSVVVPSTVKYINKEYPVVAIGTAASNDYVGAFINSGGKPVSIILPDSVCEIYQRAFEGLPNLQSISLNGDGIVIGYEAFKGCKNLNVTFRGNGAVKYISGYAFETENTNCLDFNVIKNRTDKNSWIGYDADWNNEAEWKTLVNSLSPFSISVTDDSKQNWKPDFEKLDENNGYLNGEQIVDASTYSSDYNAWIRKAAKWVDCDEGKAEIRLDVAYNPMSGKSTNDMVFVLDVSGSMFYGNYLIAGSNYSRQFQTFDQVRSVGKALLDLNESGKVYNRVGACTFGRGLRGTSSKKTDTPDGFFTDYASFVKWLDQENYLLSANTGYSFGLDEAAKLIKGRSNKDRTPSVVFLSDGEPNSGTQGDFPGTGKSTYGGDSTKKLSDLGVTRYSILLGENSSKTLEAVTLIAGKPNTYNDKTRTYKSPDAATLQQAFQEIITKIAENQNLSLSDTAGEFFEVSTHSKLTGGSVSLSGATTTWDLSETAPRQVYTLIIPQKLKRDQNNNNAFYEGKLKTNQDNAVLTDVIAGEILSVASPVLNKTLKKYIISVHVDNGVATGRDGTKNPDIIDTILESSDDEKRYVVNYEGNQGTILESIKIAASGEKEIDISTELFPKSYTIEDIRCSYDIWVKYHPEGAWTVLTSVENGTIDPKGRKANIPLGEACQVEYSPNDGYELVSISIGKGENGNENPPMAELSEVDLEQYKENYVFTENKPGMVHVIHVKYEEIIEEEEKKIIWGDYRR